MVRKFKKGDSVQLKSGGPVMNVITYMVISDIVAGAYLSINQVVCAWNDPIEGKQTGIFEQDDLRAINNLANWSSDSVQTTEKKSPLN